VLAAVASIAEAAPAPDAAASPDAPGAPSSAGGDAPVSAEVAAYEIAVENGTTAFRAGRFVEARAAFERAYSIHADPVLLFNIASCWRRLGDREAAIDAYRRFLERAPSNDDRRPLAVATIRKLETEIAIENQPTRAPRRKKRPLSRTAKIGFGVVGIGAVSLVAAGVEAYRAKKSQDDLEGLMPGTPWDREQADRYQQGEDARFRARLFGGAGGALVIAGATLVVVGGREEVAAIKVTTSSGGLQLNLRRRF
jgi:tetratricopeptide (TPR) repeat protein